MTMTKRLRHTDFSSVSVEYIQQLLSGNYNRTACASRDVDKLFLFHDYNMQVDQKFVRYDLSFPIVQSLLEQEHFQKLVKYFKIAWFNSFDYSHLFELFNFALDKRYNEKWDYVFNTINSFFKLCSTTALFNIKDEKEKLKQCIADDEFNMLSTEEIFAKYFNSLMLTLCSSSKSDYTNNLKVFLQNHYEYYENFELHEIFYDLAEKAVPKFNSAFGLLLRDIELNAYDSFSIRKVLSTTSLSLNVEEDLWCLQELKNTLKTACADHKLSVAETSVILRLFLMNPLLLDFVYKEPIELSANVLKFLLKLHKLSDSVIVDEKIDYNILHADIVLEMVVEYSESIDSIKDFYNRYAVLSKSTNAFANKTIQHIKL